MVKKLHYESKVLPRDASVRDRSRVTDPEENNLKTPCAGDEEHEFNGALA